MRAGCSCEELNTATEGSADRVGAFADKCPECECEQHSVSRHSPGPVQHEETIVRMVCSPMHVHKKKPELLPSFFGHAFSYGLSAQRLEKSTDQELAKWVNSFVTGGDDRVWLGYVRASCATIRRISRPEGAESQAFCVLDAALESNRSHIEICASHRPIDDADRIEVRAGLMRAFSSVLPRAELKDGQVCTLVNPELLAREVAEHWRSLVA